VEEIVPETRTLRGQVLHTLRAALLSGDPAPGDRINEANLAAELGVSRGTLREAFRNLEQEGLLMTIPHRGTFVRLLTAAEAVNVYEVRAALEISAAVRTAKNLTPELRQTLQGRVEAMEKADADRIPFRERLAIDIRFHETICEASGNDFLVKQWRSMNGLVISLMHEVGDEMLYALQSPALHRSLLEAILSGEDDQIQKLWRSHFDDGARQVFEVLNQRVGRSAELVSGGAAG
jgi:DNA-binding GntR family transcriptional regulator